MSLAVRPATAADIADMHQIRLRVRENRLADPASVTPASYERFVATGDAMVAMQDGALVGFAALDAEAGSVWALFVDSDAEGFGVGRALLAALCGHARNRGLRDLSLTTASASRAERFYARAGWTAAGRAANGEIVFRLNLKAAS